MYFVRLILFFGLVFLVSSGSGVAESGPADGESRNEESATRRYVLQTNAPDHDDLAEAFRGVSLLQRLIGEPPDERIGLERRLAEDLVEAGRVMQSQGYYDGVASGKIVEGDPLTVEVSFAPGERYTLGDSAILFESDAAPADSGDDAENAPKLPRHLDDVGLKTGSAAVAEDVLAAVDRIRDAFRNNGYPFAKIASSRYFLHRDQHILTSEITVDPGAFVRMGEVRIEGDPPVWDRYFEAQRNWRMGAPWDQSRADDYRAALGQGGLFQSVAVKPAEEDGADGNRAVVLETEMASPRTVSGSLRYDSEFGIGVQGGWEHRNLTDRGDRLRLEAPIWADSQRLTANYRLPFFPDAKRNLLAEAEIANDHFDAYDQRSIGTALGLEHRISRRWRFNSWVRSETGQQKDPDEDWQSFYLLGFPQTLAFDSSNDPLNATKGGKASLTLTPYVGSYNQEFTALKTRLDGAWYRSLASDDSLVLAMRAAAGSLTGVSTDDVPASVRFYSGGGGSVRGYDYQSIGPRDADKNPLGGSSFTEVGLETRWRWSESWGMAAFVDGGSVLNDRLPKPGKDMLWGAGLGARMYTMIGPVRIDVATPLNPRSGDGKFFLYISIGQSF